MPKTFVSKLLQAKIVKVIDARIIEVRRDYLRQFLAFEKNFIQFPRVIKDDLFPNLKDITKIEFNTAHSRKDALNPNIPLWQLDPSFLGDAELTQEVNLKIRDMHPQTLDFPSQVLYSDIWDHLTYGLIVATGCAEIGNIGGPAGNITAAKLQLQVADTGGMPSQGPFGIYKKYWHKPGLTDLPNNSYYVQAGHFFYKAIDCHDRIIAVNKGYSPKFFTTDPEWLIPLYRRGDLLSYILLFRRFYGGAGSWDIIKHPITGKYLDPNTFASRLLAFAINVFAICEVRDGFDKSYPSKQDPKSEYNAILNEAIKTLSNEEVI